MSAGDFIIDRLVHQTANVTGHAHPQSAHAKLDAGSE